MECAICLDDCVYPTKLPCGHIFCFLCVKSLKNFCCAICRADFPDKVLKEPELLMPVDAFAPTSTPDQNENKWFYKGRDGWWQFDERTSQDIEDAYMSSASHCSIFIAGHLYVVDFTLMLQQRQTDPSRKRQVKRDLATAPRIGIAGLRLPGAPAER